MRNFYHVLVEAEVPDGEMPNGSDFPPRKAVCDAISGLCEGLEIIDCASGWGLSREGAKNVLHESCKEKNQISWEEVKKRGRGNVQQNRRKN